MLTDELTKTLLVCPASLGFYTPAGWVLVPLVPLVPLVQVHCEGRPEESRPQASVMVSPPSSCLSSGRSSSGRPVQLCVLHGGKVCGQSVRAPALFSPGVGGLLGPQRSSQQPLVVAVTAEPTALPRLSAPFPRCQLHITFIFPWGGRSLWRSY